MILKLKQQIKELKQAQNLVSRVEFIHRIDTEIR